MLFFLAFLHGIMNCGVLDLGFELKAVSSVHMAGEAVMISLDFISVALSALQLPTPSSPFLSYLL